MEGLNGHFVNIFHVSPSLQVTSDIEHRVALFEVPLHYICQRISTAPPALQGNCEEGAVKPP